MRLIKTVPITLITGYLGSGKTTLINHILKNAKGHKMAVIVNDIGEVNIDADLIQAGGIVASKDDNLVALSNGCICCTLKKDLINQLAELVQSKKFDHILIEASGICEPVPIVQTITYMQNEFKRQNLPEFYKLDAIISVTDALRLKDEFGCGETLEEAKRGEEDLENLVIQQIEFCDIVLLNKASELTEEELRRVKMTIRAIQDTAKIIESDYCNVDIDTLIDTNLFDFEKASTSAAWIREFEDWGTDVEIHDDDDEDEDEHEHHDHDDEEHEHHHHEHDEDDDDDDHEEHEHHHHHHHDGEECDDPECECHHHHHDDDDDDEEHECCHHHEHHHDEEHGHHGHEHHHHHHHHHPGEHDADEVFTSWGRESARKYTEEELEGILKALADESGEYGQIILRAKGIIPMADGSWRQFDMVPEESEVRVCGPDYTGRVCVIGCELKEEKLAELFGLK